MIELKYPKRPGMSRVGNAEDCMGGEGGRLAPRGCAAGKPRLIKRTAGQCWRQLAYIAP
jgi:hypothetical protein